MSAGGEDVRRKMKELKQGIQFDDPVCLLFTSVRLSRVHDLPEYNCVFCFSI